MNSVADEILSHYNSNATSKFDKYLEHIGVKRRSGRYPWGSGDDPYQRSSDFLGRIEKLKKEGWKESTENIMKDFGMTTNEFRKLKGIAVSERTMLRRETAKSLKEDGLGPTEIANRMSTPDNIISESTVRGWLNENAGKKLNQARETAEFIKKQIDEKGMIDVGSGVEYELNISKEKLKQALTLLEEEGYPTYGGRFEQVTNPGKKTTQLVVCPPGTEHKDIYNLDQVHSLNEYITRDGGKTFEKKFHYPESMDSKRLKIRYSDEAGPDGITGVQKDGIIELRRGVKDLSLGESRYSQVRILVDGTHYLKGMAVYSDDMPDGIDVIFNTNKGKDKATKDVLKKIKDDPENPFGSAIKDSDKGGQYWYIDKNGNKKLGLINKRADEGDWTEWANALPSQFLAKQNLQMIHKQLDLALADKTDEYNSICSLTNPTVKKNLLEDFANNCDSAAVNLKAAALPGQKYHVIIPINTLKDNEVYAPGYADGDKLALIRFPHGGTFEIPICTVNNKNQLGSKIIGKQSIDAIGITSKVADRLSGADFDGDTVMCIPTHDKYGKVKVTSTKPLTDLEGFNPKEKYGSITKLDSDGNEHYYRSDGKEFRRMSSANTQKQMGVISNLITDMTLKGAKEDELARAVKHSMVVIDAEKHKLDYKQSELDNDIPSLKKKYQSFVDDDGKEHVGGASTLLSRAKGEATVIKRQGSPRVNLKSNEGKLDRDGNPLYDPTRPEGALLYKTADDATYEITKTNKRTGATIVETRTRTDKITRMEKTDDAYTLISDANSSKEKAYAEYANQLKKLANEARVTIATTGKIAYSKNANDIYKSEVKSLEDKLAISTMNRPKERQAQRLANSYVTAKKLDNPGMTKGDIKKANQIAIKKYRDELGAKRQPIVITDREWEAIQAGAISENKLNNILKNTDKDNLRQRATPRATNALTTSQINRIKRMNDSNYSLEQIAKALGKSTSTVSKYLKGE